ncbi:MAG: DNA-binding protein WhiA [Pseudonocardia sp.]
MAGLRTTGGRAVLGLPTRVMHGAVCDAAALWRAALLASGAITNPTRPRPGLVVACTNPALALGLVGLARHLGATARLHPGGGAGHGEHVVITDPGGITTILTAAGGQAAVTAWPRQHHPTPTASSREFTTANTERARRAATTQAETVAAVFAGINPDQLPAHLREAGQLRLAHPTLSLAQVAEHATPPITKDALGGRLRRLCALAEHLPDVDRTEVG